MDKLRTNMICEYIYIYICDIYESSMSKKTI